MPTSERLHRDDVTRRLLELPAWKLEGEKLHREYRFPDFVAAFSWMTAVAIVAEKENHHPEWKNVYGTVAVDLTTHDAGGITARDFTLAKRMDEFAARSEGR